MMLLRQINKKWIYRVSNNNKRDLQSDLDDQLKQPYKETSRLMDIRSKNTFSLMDLDQRFGLLKQNDRVLELGCSPGGWSQHIVKSVKNDQNRSQNTVLSVDIVDMPIVEGSYFMKGSIDDQNIQKQIQKYFDYQMIECVLCDITPNYGEDDDYTHFNYLDINDKVIQLCKKILKPGGTLLMKSYKGMLRDMKQKQWAFEYDRFKRVRPIEVTNWMEFYYLGQGFRMNQDYLQQNRIMEYLNKLNIKQQKRILMDIDRMQKMFGVGKEELIGIWTKIIQQSIIDKNYEQEFNDDMMDRLQNQFKHNFRRIKLESDRYQETVDKLNRDSSIDDIYSLLKDVDQDGIFSKLYHDHYLPSFKEVVENQNEMYDQFYKEEKIEKANTLLRDEEEYGRNYGESDQEIFNQKEEHELKQWEKFCRDHKVSEQEMDDPDLFYQRLMGNDNDSKQAREDQDEIDEMDHRQDIIKQKIKLKQKVVKQKVYSKGSVIDEFQSFEEAVEKDLSDNYDKIMKNIEKEDFDRTFKEVQDDFDSLLNYYDGDQRNTKEDINRYDNMKDNEFSDKFKNRKF